MVYQRNRRTHSWQGFLGSSSQRNAPLGIIGWLRDVQGIRLPWKTLFLNMGCIVADSLGVRVISLRRFSLNIERSVRDSREVCVASQTHLNYGGTGGGGGGAGEGWSRWRSSCLLAITVNLLLSKALFLLDPDNLQPHCFFFWWGTLFCCSIFCPLDQPYKML